MKKGLLALFLISFLVLPIGLVATTVRVPAPDLAFLTGLDRIGDLIFTILLAAAVIAVLVGAFQMVTAGGDPEKFTQGRTYVLYAVVAIIVAILARGLITFIRNMIEHGRI